MRKSVAGKLLLALGVVLAPPAAGLVQDGVPALRLGGAVAMAGQPVALHLQLPGDWDGGFHRLSLTLVFPVRTLAFDNMELSYQLESRQAALQTQPEAEGRLRLELSLRPEAAQGLGGGGLGFLNLRVLEDALPQVLTVRMENIRIEGPGGETLQPEPVEARINLVSEELYPLISCFFYMH